MAVLKEFYDTEVRMNQEELFEFIDEAAREADLNAQEIFDEIFLSEREFIQSNDSNIFSVEEVTKEIEKIYKNKAIG